jgi:hypothetical protein
MRATASVPTDPPMKANSLTMNATRLVPISPQPVMTASSVPALALAIARVNARNPAAMATFGVGNPRLQAAWCKHLSQQRYGRGTRRHVDSLSQRPLTSRCWSTVGQLKNGQRRTRRSWASVHGDGERSGPNGLSHSMSMMTYPQELSPT